MEYTVFIINEHEVDSEMDKQEIITAMQPHLDEIKAEQEKMLAKCKASSNPRHQSRIADLEKKLAAIEKMPAIIQSLDDSIIQNPLMQAINYQNTETLVGIAANTCHQSTRYGMERTFDAIRNAAA